MDYLIELLAEIKRNHMIRSTEEQKENFRKYIIKELKESGCAVIEDRGKMKGHGFKEQIYCNLETENKEYEYVITAHYDTANQMNLITLISFISSIDIISKLLKNHSILKQLVSNLLLIFVLFSPSILFCFFNYARIAGILAIISGCYIITSIYKSTKRPNINNINDNSSGVIALLSIARRLKDSGQNEKVKFILFDQEEKGLCGSKGRYRLNEGEFKDKVLINLDCVGIGDTLIVSYLDEGNLDDKFVKILLYDLEKRLNENHKVSLRKIHKYISSDYINFKNSIALSLGLFEKKFLTYRLLNYHRSSDKYIELQKVEEIAKTISDNIIR